MLQFIVDKLFWPVTPLLESVGQHEPQVEKLRERLRQAIVQAVIALVAYAVQYEPYLGLINLDIASFVQYVVYRGAYSVAVHVVHPCVCANVCAQCYICVACSYGHKCTVGVCVCVHMVWIGTELTYM